MAGCISPIYIGKSAEKDSPNMFVPCNRCYMCLKRRRNEWTVRLIEEYRASVNGYFITLTYDPENIPIQVDNETGLVSTPLVKEHLSGWVKRMRSRKAYRYKKIHTTADPSWEMDTRYFGVGEYGEENKRPHYHILLFNYPSNHILKDTLKSWNKGRIQVGNVTQASIHYCAKYCLKDENFSIMSRGYTKKDEHGNIIRKVGGIGYQYAQRIGDYHADTGNHTYKLGKYEHPLPKYLKGKVNGKYDPNHKSWIIKKMDANYFQQCEILHRKGYKDPENELISRLRNANEKGLKKTTLNRLD